MSYDAYNVKDSRRRTKRDRRAKGQYTPYRRGGGKRSMNLSDDKNKE